MQWKKLGLLYSSGETNKHPKLLTHAANPLPVRLEGDIYRVFFNGRDLHNRSSVGAVDIDIVQRKIIQKHYQPFFEHGPEGSFYADGVSIGSCYRVGDTLYMFFMGWQAPNGQHWRGDMGRLVVNPDLTLRLDEQFFMGTSAVDPISLSYPWVQEREDGYQMWYGSTLSWDAGNGEMLHVINSAFSKDGHSWVRQGRVIPYEVGVAQAFSRPTVVKHNDGHYDMWFSFRSGTGEKYRIGRATSGNGLEWELALDAAGITPSEEGWDAEMIEYPYILEHSGQKYMLYNGNGYGKTGFGVAVWEG